jgi:predicted transcriptional regulator
MKTIVIGLMPQEQIRARTTIAVLAKATGRQPGNLSRTLKTMSRYGLVDLQREKNHVRPLVKASEFRIVAAA